MHRSNTGTHISSARGVLAALGITWRTAENLTRLHELALQAYSVLARLSVLYTYVDTPESVRIRVCPDTVIGLWQRMLLRTATACAMFPDKIPGDQDDWDHLAAMWDDHLIAARPATLLGIHLISDADGWEKRAAIRAAWNEELAENPTLVRVGPVVENSAHRALIVAAETFQTESNDYVCEASERSDDRAALWDAIIARWCTRDVVDQLAFAKAALSTEYHRLKASFAPTAPTAAAQPAPKDATSVDDARDFAEGYVARHPWPGLREMRRKILAETGRSCSTSTVKKAIESSPDLLKARDDAEALARKTTSVSTAPLQGKDLDRHGIGRDPAVDAADRDAAKMISEYASGHSDDDALLESLLAAVKESQQDDLRKKWKTYTPEQRRRIAATYADDADTSHRTRGRSR